RIAAGLRAFWAKRWPAPHALRRTPIALFAVFVASGAACVVGAVQLSAAASSGESAQHAAAQPTVTVSASQSSAGTTQGADVHILADNSTGAVGATAQSTVTSTVSSSGTGQPNTSVTVNGQQIPVPDNGSVNRTISDASGTTTVQVNSDSSNSSSVNVQVNSTSSSGGGGQ
ncbi:MAG: hypothetical protein ACREBW_05575, partial [Candidatus Micrarchaeaceae archaeon]